MRMWPRPGPRRPSGREAAQLAGGAAANARDAGRKAQRREAGRARNGTPRQEPRREADPQESRTRRNRARDPHERHVPFAERKRQALEDLAVYRAVSFQDLSDARFGGNDFAARRGVSQLQAAGLVVRGTGWGPKGRPFLVLAATPSGSREAARNGRPGQRRWHGLVKPAEAHHDTAVYRAALERIAELESEGFRITRVRIDAELKSELAKAAERARAAGGDRAAREAQHRKARELGLPVEGGKVHVPDVQIEYEPAGERAGLESGRANVEVVTASYKAGSIRAKAALGFHLAASGSAAAGKMRDALGLGRNGTGGRQGRGGDRIDFGETEGRGGGIGGKEEFEF